MPASCPARLMLGLLALCFRLCFCAAQLVHQPGEKTDSLGVQISGASCFCNPENSRSNSCLIRIPRSTSSPQVA